MNITDKHIAIDGKACRGSRNKEGKMIHLLQAYLTDDCSFLGQEKINQKSNELRSISQFLKKIEMNE